MIVKYLESWEGAVEAASSRLSGDLGLGALQPGFSGPVFLCHLRIPENSGWFLGFGESGLNQPAWLCKSNRTAGGQEARRQTFPKRSVFSFRSVAGLFPLFLEKGWRAFSQFSVCSTVGRSWSKPTSLSCGFWPCFAGVWIPQAGL